jgi:hypothetical protein
MVLPFVSNAKAGRVIYAPAFGAWLSDIWKGQSDERIAEMLRRYSDADVLRVDSCLIRELQAGHVRNLMVIHVISEACGIPLLEAVSRLARSAGLTNHRWRSSTSPGRRKGDGP